MTVLTRANPTPQPPPRGYPARRGEGELDSKCPAWHVPPNSPSPRRGGGWGVGFARVSTVIALLLLTTACTTRVTGHTSPIAHDYGPVEWHALQGTIVQQFVYGPGLQAAIANDGDTTPEQFQERLAALPDDVRDGELIEIVVGLRLAGESEIEQVGKWNTGARLQVVRGVETVPFIDVPVDSIPRDGDWIVLDAMAPLQTGEIVSLRLVPGDGPDAERLHYGITPSRAPYGGWMATDEAGSSAGGALLVRTVYERDVDARSLVEDGLGSLRTAARDDLVFSAGWLLILAGLLAAAGWIWRLQPSREG